MPKFIIPAGIKLQNKADMQMIEALGKVIDAGSKGVVQFHNYEHNNYTGILKQFRLVEQKHRLLKARKGFKGYMKAIPNLYKDFQKASPTDPNAFKLASRNLTEAVSYASTDSPQYQYYLVATAKGKKLYEDIQISLSGD